MASFRTLFLPFDFVTWIFVIVSTVVVASMLFQMDKYWIRLQQDKSEFIENNKYRGGASMYQFANK